MVNICYRATEPAVDQECYYDSDDLKLYLCNTELLFTQSFRSLNCNPEFVYESILRGDLDIYEGMYFENMVAQELMIAGHNLFFSKFEHKDSKRLQEVDFIIVKDRLPTPLEVKSGKRPNMHKSLDSIVDKYGSRLGMPYVICTKDVSIKDGIRYIPIYMASLL